MPDYTRLVSYIYNYEEGIKRNNVGYARVETRNGRCKYTLHIAAPSLNNHQLKAYIFKRHENGIHGVLLGTLQVRNGMGDFKIMTDSTHIMNSPYQIQDMAGVVIYFSDSKFFASEWDDIPITKEDVASIEKNPNQKENLTEQSQKTEQDVGQSNKMLSEAAPQESKKKADILIPEKHVDVKKEEKQEDIELPIKQADIEKPETVELQKDIDIPEIKEIEKKCEILQNEDTPVESEQLQGKETLIERELQLSEDIPPECEQTQDRDEGMEYEMPEEKENYEEQKIWFGMPMPEAIENPEADEDNWEKEMQQKVPVSDECTHTPLSRKTIFEDHPLAKRIYRTFPRMYPFEDNDVAWCVRIEPQDIGLFPMEAWILGNNSFLLHGYYSYRHLIFARINDRSGINYIIGVPGVYHNREKFMAKMFGFENFKCVKRKELKTGEFGYWYIPIVLH